MKTASISEIKANFAAYIKATESGAVVVTRNGRPVTVLLGVQNDDEVERLILAHPRKLRAIRERSKQQIREVNWLSHEDFWKQVDAEAAERPEPEPPPPRAQGRKPRQS